MSEIRAVALALIRRPSDEALLVSDSTDAGSGRRYHRPLGGEIAFGETGAEAIRRTFKNDLGIELIGVRLSGVLENIFTKEGDTGHEIVLVYGAEFADEKHYEAESFSYDAGGAKHDAVWTRLSATQTKDNPDGPPLVPDGIAELARQA